MLLKQLDVAGFKSFASRITVEFVPGVTAVVGPNGSGKSNIIDAIRWVLGEQSAKSLRGAKMEDIIFAGSESRKPLNIAEVTLTLTNDDQFLPVDYHEVSVTRRVYRSGESEFFINKQSCRLKDIVDLFMDSGLGREAFSIISQGKVEEILSSKAEERRTIFEEAAGVLKYKMRKKKAEHKLMETQDNLNRVEDILFEIEGQIEPLQIQASIAKDFMEKKAALKETEVALTAFEIESLHQKWAQLRQTLNEHKDEEIGLQVNLQKTETTIEQLRTHMQSLDDQVTRLQDQLLQESNTLEKLEGQKQVLSERKKNANQNQDQLEKNAQEYATEVEETKQLLSTEQEKWQYLKEELQELKSRLALVTTQLEATNGQRATEIEHLKSEYIERLNKQATYRHEHKYLSEQLVQLQAKEAKRVTDNQKNLSLRESISNKKQMIQAKLEDGQAQLKAETQTAKQLEQTLEQQRAAYDAKQIQLNKAFQFIQQFRSKKEMLETMQEDYSGFFQGVKEVLKAKLKGVEGAVAELITVSKQFETAIEIALGGAMQNIVTDTDENARAAIQFLKQKKGGRATFLPMSTIKGRTIPTHQLQFIQNHPAFIGMAAELVTFADRHKEIITNLLGHVIVAGDLKGANELAKLSQFRYRIVTLDGDVVNPGGSMTGGSVKQNTNSLLARSRELETITTKLEDAERKTVLLEEQVTSLKEQIKENEAQYRAAKQLVDQMRFSEQELKATLREAEIEEKNINERLAVYDYEREMFHQEVAKTSDSIDEAERTLTALASELVVIEQQINASTDQLKQEQMSKESLQAEITELKVKVASKQQEVKNQYETILRLEDTCKIATDKLQETRELLQLLTQEVVTNKSGESELDVKTKEAASKKQETITLIQEKRKQRLQLLSDLEAQEREVKEMKRLSKQANMLIKDEEVQVNRLDVEIENKLSHLRTEYELTYEAAKEKYPMTMQVNDARQQVKLIKKAITELGTVNLGAIDEYERIAERYRFLGSQQTDLIEAKQTLHQVIEEMDQEMKKKFEAQFLNIKAQFGPVFKALFGGGQADLLLTNPDDLLLTGVDIVAQPPGKKLQPLSLLSGGERALTAIALLFAILKVRPVPFCILDEVEAALDEANVNRFARYLKNFSAHTQFIVITHRKGTMEEVDVLYGVTMQESGVSSLVSVKLEDTKQLVES